MKKDFFKDKISATLRLSDVLNTREFNINSAGENFIGSVRWKRETRVFYAGLTWRFGKGKPVEPPRRARDENQGIPSGDGF